ncbi:MAG: hypothetical protein V7677_19865 [Motiliproteus sp.]
MNIANTACLFSLSFLFLVLTPNSNTYANTINFSGQLDFIDLDAGGALYSGLPLGTNFLGAIDDVSFSGFISDGATNTSFGCCIFAGGLEVSNNEILDTSEASIINSFLGPIFSAGDEVDGINIEGDAVTAGGGRIEIGLSFLFDPSTFSDNSLSNYPPNPSDILLALFFITELDDQENDIYSAVGELNAIPIPSTVVLFGIGLLGMIHIRSRK